MIQNHNGWFHSASGIHKSDRECDQTVTVCLEATAAIRKPLLVKLLEHPIPTETHFGNKQEPCRRKKCGGRFCSLIRPQVRMGSCFRLRAKNWIDNCLMLPDPRPKTNTSRPPETQFRFFVLASFSFLRGGQFIFDSFSA